MLEEYDLVEIWEYPIPRPMEFPYLLWMGECRYGHKIHSVQQIYKIRENCFGCKACKNEKTQAKRDAQRRMHPANKIYQETMEALCSS